MPRKRNPIPTYRLHSQSGQAVSDFYDPVTGRKRMVEMGWCRREVNKQVGRVRHVFKWAAGEELVPAVVFEGLKAVGGLQAGRTEARETAPVQPVAEGDYLATLPYLPRVPRAIVEFMRFTGCRPGEACRLTLDELDRSGELWVYRPGRHKTQHHGKARSIVIGPNGQAALLRFLAGRVPAPVAPFDPTHPVQRLAAAAEYERHHRPIDAALLRDLDRPVAVVGGYVAASATPLFDPARDRLERFAEMRKNRKSKVTPCQVSRKKANPKVMPRTEYNPEALHHAVGRAAVKAGVPPWHPNQIRHLRATEVRKLCGLEAAQVVLGHAKADVTQMYAERNDALAATVARRIG